MTCDSSGKEVQVKVKDDHCTGFVVGGGECSQVMGCPKGRVLRLG